MLYKSIYIALLALIFSGCAREHFSRNINLAKEKALTERTAFSHKNNTPQKPLSWGDAVKLLKERNLTYLQSIRRLELLEEDKRKFVWNQLNPRVIATTNLNSFVSKISSIDSSQINTSIIGSIRLPDPISFYAQRYAMELQYYQLKLDHEMLERRLQISLYSYFLTQQEIEDSAVNDINPSTELGVEAHIKEKIRIEKALANEVKSIERLNLNINSILNTPRQNWILKSLTIPDISYANNLSSLEIENGYARMAVKQSALRIETSLARVRQVKLSNLPILSNSISLPSIYRSSSDAGFDASNISIFTSVNKPFDFTGSTKRSKASAIANHDTLRQSMLHSLERDILSFNQLKRSYKLNIKESKYLKSQLSWLKSNPPEGWSSLVINHIEEMNSLNQKIKRNKERQTQIDIRFWLWDDSYWGDPFDKE